MAPDEMHQHFGEYTAIEIARHVADLRTPTHSTSSARSWHVARMPRQAISGLMSRLTSRLMSRLHAHTEPVAVEPVKPHAIPFSH